MLKKIGLNVLSLLFFVVLSIAVIMVTNVFFNKKSSFFDRNVDTLDNIKFQIEESGR